ncbi:3-oxoacyl-ACP reductase [Streptomyces longisporoflavus]|uniref:SDR family NAD(P)-dependent oxidoreductase n=1 Tax=Streptomyces longisporoflavus TaxID=28044 RepID=UPI00167D25DA|nr:SDR family oxidoreductase [Streptomyces longisporoflavus]GGV71900.1 3-oxoacyl-ACP reductase [Streptomyces longisporoflavus]
MDLEYAGKSVVVTAAGRGIGAATARTFLAEGARVLGADLNVSPELKESGALTFEGDLTTEEGAKLLAQRAAEEFPDGVDVLVNGVGGLAGMPITGLDGLTEEVWQRGFDLNLNSAVRVTRELLPQLRESVVTIASSVGRWPSQGPYFYASSKAALRAWSKSLADDLGPRGIRVNSVSPGLITTPLWDEYGPRLSKEWGVESFEQFAEEFPAMAHVTSGRWGTPQEVANLIVFLGSPAASYITGADYLIDGGMEKVL